MLKSPSGSIPLIWGRGGGILERQSPASLVCQLLARGPHKNGTSLKRNSQEYAIKVLAFVGSALNFLSC